MAGTASAGTPARPPAADDPRAACRAKDVDPDWFTPQRYSIEADAQAKKICRNCDIRADCLAWALEHPQEDGIYGGYNPHERHRILHPYSGGRGQSSRGRETGTAANGRHQWREVDVEVLRVRFAAARPVAEGRASIDDAVAATGVTRSNISSAVSILRNAPHLVPQLLAGMVTYTSALTQARQVTRSRRRAS